MSWKALLVFRPLNLLMLIASQSLVFYFLNPEPVIIELINPQIRVFVALVFSSVLIAAAGYLINDLFDRELDKQNKPGKTYISIWTNSQINSVYVFLNVAALVIGFWIGWGMFQVFLATIIILYLYSAKFQKWPLIGNISIAFLAALSLLIIKFVAFEIPALLLLFYACFAFLISLIREISKDIQDLEGDQRHKHNTAVVAWGLSTSKYLALVLSIFAFAAYFYTYKLWLAQHIFPDSLRQANIYNLVFVGIPFFLLIGFIVKSKSSEEFGFVSSICKYLMYTGMLGMVFF
jgi:4-hydroxybenzoate polyprenyltransferase